MRRVLPQLIVVAAGGLAFGMVYRCFLDDPSEASVANYLRSGVHGMSVAVVGGAPIATSICEPAHG